jgi:hypothetical protein
MDCDPDDAQQYQEVVDYPASKEELVGMIQSLGPPEFYSLGEVLTELRAFPQSS